MLRESDGEMSLETTNSPISSGTESCSSFSRLSFDAPPSSTTAIIPEEESFLSLKPHRSSDFAYSEIRRRKKHGLTFRDFRLMRRIGAGDIGTVYLCRLAGEEEESRSSYFAMKVVDKEALALKKKMHRAEMEKTILKMLDHPFLPTLYAEFEASHFSCIVMEYCSGGDLHSLRHKQPHRRFTLSSTRFYAAEVLVALEYLHMLGIIYRDLKPENILVRSDGHIMLSDFDLSLRSDSIAAVESSSSSPENQQQLRSPRRLTRLARLFHRVLRSKKVQTLEPNRLFVAEPVTARSGSFVGTHEYVAPEVASGGSHGNAVDWWAFGVFLYEMIYGKTPFVAPTNDVILRNIVKRQLSFPTDSPATMFELHARSLISGLLNKDPTKRLGSRRGAAEVKVHPFFKGLNFALIRTLTPPEIPSSGVKRPVKSATFGGRSSNKPAAFDYF
ncbi:PREDICTED: protein kinase PINOID [Camelina sativa]|uniref:non-specific serine/threonine protein kinase n=1 Tax=Camelina sativa TaxID=90675 RepID=A0ABM0YRQ7_CAMSA|nr:PREDICTED: protein kinase PINOID [Camelina sativa]